MMQTMTAKMMGNNLEVHKLTKLTISIMATIKHFEDILSWKKARKLCKSLGELIDQGKFKHSYKLIDQLESSSGFVMNNIAEELNVVAIKSLFNSYIFRRVLVVNFDHNCTERWIEIILIKMNLTYYMVLQKKLLYCFKN